MNGYEAIAASLTGLAGWAEDELAAHRPPRWVAQQAAERTRQIAFMAGLAGSGKITEAVLAGILLGEDGGGDTLTLGHPGLQPSGRRKWRPARYIRQRLAGIWARAWLSS